MLLLYLVPGSQTQMFITEQTILVFDRKEKQRLPGS